MATYRLTSFHHSHLTRQDAIQVECFFLERMVFPTCGVCPGSVVPLACGIFCRVGPPGESYLPHPVAWREDVVQVEF